MALTPVPSPKPPAAWRLALTDPVVWWLVVAGLASRVVVGLLAPAHGPVGDEAEYIAAARVLADGRGFSYYDAAPWLRPPGYLFVLAATFLLSGPSGDLARWLQVGLSLALGPLVAWLGWLVTARRAVARLAAGASLLVLPLAVLPWLLLTETLVTLALLLGLGGLLERWRGGGRGWLVLAGLALGGACLLRGLAVGYVLLAVAGLMLGGPGGARRRLLDGLLVLGVVAAVVAPWTARNALAYRALVPLETTAAYNLWLRAQGGRGESWMLSELREWPDPASRQTHALGRGLALIRQDPATYLATGAREVGDLWRLNFGAAERLMTGFSGGEVGRPWLALSFLLDDLPTLLLLPLAALGLARRGGAGRWLTVGLLGLTSLTALVFFAIVRFRLPILPLLAIYAGLALVEWRPLIRDLAARRPGAWLALAAAGGLVVLMAPSLDLGAYATGWRARPAWEAAEAAETRRRGGDPAGALALLEGLDRPVPAVTLTRALVLADLGRVDEAERPLAEARTDAWVLVVRGELRRRAGDLAGAARLWNTREVDEANPLDWAWHRVGQPARRVEVGDGLDLGLVRGAYADERDGGRRYRWSDGRAELRSRLDQPGRGRLLASLRGYRPPGSAPVTVTVLVDGQTVGAWRLTGDWEQVELPVEYRRPDPVVTLLSDTFVPGFADPRALGVMIDWVETRVDFAPDDPRAAEG